MRPPTGRAVTAATRVSATRPAASTSPPPPAPLRVAATPGGAAARTETNRRLTPYVPRLVVDWLRETPDAVARTVDGSLLFADISGFTRLSEALARRGKLGAELMRDSLNAVFTGLLDDAYDFGAGLIKWGGDAILLLFDGDDHAARACRAAWEMQRTIARVGRLRAPGGTVVLRMSVGVSSGPIQFFLVGEIHRELLVAGPTATETVEMEAIADAGEIALSPSLAAALDRASRGPRKDGAILLAEPPPARRERAREVGDVGAIDIAECIPVAVRGHVLLERSEPEHRTITAAFIDLADTDLLLEELGAGALGVELDARLRTIQEAALRYEVPFYETDVGKGSVKVLLTAGAPSSTGHDEERMLRCLREIVEAPGRIPLRVGVNTGKVFAGDFGPSYRRAYRVFGDAINTAARVMSRAEPGQILATETVLERSRTLFRTTAVEPFAAKGKALPIRARIVGPVTGTREGMASGLFGAREGELRALLEALAETGRGRGWTVEISGARGLGKTRLVEEALVRSAGIEVLRARCDEYRAGTPYYPLRTALRAVVGTPADASHDVVEGALRAAVGERLPHLEPWIPVLAIPFGLDLPATPESARLEERFLRGRLAELTGEFLSVMLRDRCAVLFVEDLQHADEATLDLLGAAGRSTRDEGGRPWALVLTRDGGGAMFAPEPAEDDAPWLALSLLPLPLRSTTSLIELVSEEDPLPPHVVEEIARRSAGNVLFLFELLAAARTTGSLPDSVEALVAAQIDRLEPRDRDLVRYASVLGSSFDPGLLEAALRDELELDEDVWTRVGDIVEPEPGGGRRFRNALIRETAYEGLPYRRRKQLHAWLAHTIEARARDGADDEAATLALHFHEAQDWAKAWQYGRRAAERATALYANVEAAALWAQAIDGGRRLSPRDPRGLAAAHEALGDVRFLLGEFERSALAYRAARHLLDRGSPEAGEVALKEALIPHRLGDQPRTLRRLTRALHALEGSPGRAAAASRARLCARYAAVRFRQGRQVEAIAWCARAEREARRGGAQDALAYAYLIHDMALLAQGRPEEARRSPAALAIYEQLGDLVHQAGVLNNMGLLAYEQGRWSEARELYARAGTIWESTGDRWSASFAVYNGGEILSDQGHLDRAEEQLRAALRVWRASGAAAAIAQATRQLGRLASRGGDDGGALRLLESAREQQLALGEASEVPWTEAWIAEASVLAGQPEGAIETVRDLLGRTRDYDPGGRHLPTLQRIHGWALLALGRDEEAAAAFAAGLALARQHSTGFELAALLEGALLASPEGSPDRPGLERELETTLRALGLVVRPAARLRLRGA